MHATRTSRRAFIGAVAALTLLAGSAPANAAPQERRPLAAASTGGATAARPATRPGFAPIRCPAFHRCV
jgi:hypothetical protein